MSPPTPTNADTRTDIMPSRSFLPASSDESNTTSQTVTDGGTFVNVDVNYFLDTSSTDLSTSAVLHYCKRKVLIPYFRLLALLGWRRLLNVTQNEEPGYCVRIINVGYLLAVIAFLIIGYILQCASCFRRDGFAPYLNVTTAYRSDTLTSFNYTSKKSILLNATENNGQVCAGNLFSVYLVPDFLHFLSYLYMLYMMRTENEQLQTLMERVFLQSSITRTWHFGQRKLVRKLRMFLGMAFCWLVLSIAAQVFHILNNLSLSFTWMEAQAESFRVLLICVMLVCLMWSDAICVAIATSYSIYCQLIISYLNNLCGSVREKTLSFQDFVKDIEESRKFIKHLNNKPAVGVSILILNVGCNTAVAISGILTGNSEITGNTFKTLSTVLTIILWIGLLACPIIQAIRLTDTCNSVRKLGHELRSRPFGYQDTSQQNLDSLLLYTSNLNMKARLFQAPVRSSCLLFGLATVAFFLLYLGQLHFILK